MVMGAGKGDSFIDCLVGGAIGAGLSLPTGCPGGDDPVLAGENESADFPGRGMTNAVVVLNSAPVGAPPAGRSRWESSQALVSHCGAVKHFGNPAMVRGNPENPGWADGDPQALSSVPSTRRGSNWKG